MSIDLSTADAARKVLHDLVERQKNQSTAHEQLDAKVADLKSAVQTLHEKAAFSPSPVSGSENELKQFVREDGRVRAVGEATKEDGWMPGLLDSEPVCRWQADFQRAVEVRNIVRFARKDGKSPAADRAVKRLLDRAPDTVRRAFADSSGAGAEWIPDLVLPTVERDLTLQRRVAGLFQTMPMSAKDIKLPFLSTGFRPYLKGTVTGDDPAQYASSSLTTDQRNITAVGFAVRTQIDEDAAEDSIVDSYGIIRQELLTAIVDGEEDAIINGDTGTHQDTGIANWDIRSRWGTTGLGSAADHRRAWIGLRARAADVSCTTDGSGAETYAGFMAGRAALDAPHGVAGDLVCIVSPEYLLAKMVNFSEVLTVDKMGPNAFILSGQLASLGGVPLVISEFVDKAYNASGVYDNVTTNKTGFLLLNRQRFKLGVRRGSSVELDKDITRGIYNQVVTVREVLFTTDGSTRKNVHWNYNHSIA